MDLSSTERIVYFLEQTKQRPGMYFGGNAQNLLSFLHGFNMACSLFGYTYKDEVYQDILHAHGWNISPSMSLSTHLLDEGMDVDSIINEVLSIEIETWKQSVGNEEEQREQNS